MTIKKSILAGAAALALTAGAASAATVTVSGTPNSDPGGNAFATGGLSGLTFLEYISLTVNGTSVLTFTEVGAESSFQNNFTETGTGQTLSENANFGIPGFAEGDSFSVTFAGGTVIDTLKFFSTSTGGVDAEIGDAGFAAYVAGGAGDAFTTFFLAYDDGTIDDNHDDYVIRVDVSAVPLPAAGWMLLAGLGGIAAMKRRKKA